MPDEDSSPVLQAEGLTKRYGRRTALTECDLKIPRGRVIGLVGPNGAGKSTLLQLACGLIAPTSGSLHVLGSRPASSAANLARVGFVAQDTPVYGSFSVADHLRMGARLNPSWDQALAERRIARAGLDPAHTAGRLSGGQRAQLALTIAAAKRPELLIFDEPAAALDPLARDGFLRNLTEFVAELGASAVLSSHLLGDVERVCDYLVVLCGSRCRSPARCGTCWPATTGWWRRAASSTGCPPGWSSSTSRTPAGTAARSSGPPPGRHGCRGPSSPSRWRSSCSVT